MLSPYWRENQGYEFISSDDKITIPSSDLENKISIDDVLDGIINFYFGETNMVHTFILNNVDLIENIVNIYYYTFIPPNTVNINGHIKDLEKIKYIQSYNKIISKLI
jgi:hypothetical protein